MESSGTSGSSNKDYNRTEDKEGRLQLLNNEIAKLNSHRLWLAKMTSTTGDWSKYSKWQAEMAKMTKQRAILLEEKRVDNVLQSFKDEGVSFYSVDHEKLECLVCNNSIVDMSIVLSTPCCGLQFCMKCHETYVDEKLKTSSTVTCPYCTVEYPTEGEEIKHMIAQANAGKEWAQFRLYQVFKNESGKEELARQWLRMAANNGHVEAQFTLASQLILENDSGVNDESFGLYRAAAIGGNGWAQLCLARTFLSRKNHGEAIRWCTFAAFQGRPVVDARWEMAQLYLGEFGLCGLEVSEELAVYWYKRALEQEEDYKQSYWSAYSKIKNLEPRKLQYQLAQALAKLAKKKGARDVFMPEVLFWIRQSASNGFAPAVEWEKQILEETGNYCHGCAKIPSEDEKLRRCSRCKYAKYCDRECQINVWKTHKHVCYDPAATAKPK